MGRKNAITPFAAINGASMAANIVGEHTDLMHLDNVAYFVKWTGTSPIGVIKVQVTNDSLEPGKPAAVWQDLDFGTPISISGNSGSHLININQMPAKHMRITYEASSGTGALTAILTAKMLGG